MDLAGRVEAAGRDVTRLRPGDAVFGWTDTGSYAEYTSVPEDHLAPMPSRPCAACSRPARSPRCWTGHSRWTGVSEAIAHLLRGGGRGKVVITV
jgi:threonine dehydrogenase-like Zn-dependent dehydrogenase